MSDVTTRFVICMVAVDECESDEEAQKTVANFFDPLVNNGYDWLHLLGIVTGDAESLDMKTAEELYSRK